MKKKTCESKVTEFLKQEYVLPKLGIYKGKVVHFSPMKKFQDAIDLNGNLTKEIASSKKKLAEVRQKMYASNRNAGKKLKRREAIIAHQKACINSQQQEMEIHKKLQGANHQVSQLRAKLNRVNHHALYWKKRVTEISVQRNSYKIST